MFHSSSMLKRVLICIDTIKIQNVDLQVSANSAGEAQTAGFILFVIASFGHVTALKKKLGPVVQSIVSLTTLLKGQLIKCSATLLPKTLIFLLKK